MEYTENKRFEMKHNSASRRAKATGGDFRLKGTGCRIGSSEAATRGGL